jgi:putative SOS response-associated peptidase YedK
MPVIVAPLDYSTWLNPHSDSPALLNLIRGFSPAEMKLRPVSRLVNSPTHDSPDCIATLAD